jgi:hypothetical protein
MSNELLDIADKLNGYKDGEGWTIITATKRNDGGWDLTILPVATESKKSKEATK